VDEAMNDLPMEEENFGAANLDPIHKEFHHQKVLLEICHHKTDNRNRDDNLFDDN
jgi:hypothetical protein